MAAPKGTKLASGYRDRAQDHNNDIQNDNGDDREARIKALEEQMKLGQIEPEVFVKLRDTITGGDISATHLVKGLDRQLLQRVRRGEDVLNGKDEVTAEGGTKDEQGIDADEELDRLEEKEIAPMEREKVVKKGMMAPPPLPVAGVKRSRNDILAELKASRKAAAEAKAAAQPTLSSKFKKVGTAKPSPKIEIDDRGREVLITVDENGNIKRKVRKVVKDDPTKQLLMPDKAVKPLGMIVPEAIAPVPTVVNDEEEDDIFEGVGDSYNPLGDAEEDDTSSDEDNIHEKPKQTQSEQIETTTSATSATSLSPHQSTTSTSPPPTTQPTKTTSIPKRNYFNDTSAPSTTSETPASHLTDPAFLATLSKAAAIATRAGAASSETSDALAADATKPTIAQRLLARQDRDFEDMDMGFGGSRFDDADEMDEGGKKVKLSQWKGLQDDGDDDGEEEGGVKKAKGRGSGQGRGKGADGGKSNQKGRKKGGDKNSAADVLRVIEGRKAK